MTTYLNWSLTYASTETITLQPGSEGKDSDVDAGFPDSNSGSYEALWVGHSTDKWRACGELIYSSNWVIPLLPAGAVITYAYLRLYQYNFTGSGSFSVGLYKVTGNWGEDSITWNNQPTSSSEAEAFCNIATGNDKGVYFRSSDYTTGNTKCPKLEIDYYIP